MEAHDLMKQAKVVVVMVPFPSQGHLNQLLHLSCLISSYNIPVHYACSATHVRQAKLRFHAMDSLNKINFNEISTPPLLSPQSPSQLHPCFESSLLLRKPIFEFLSKMSSEARKIIVIYDVLMTYVVQDIVTLQNAEAYSFRPSSAFSTVFDSWQLIGKPFELEEPTGLPDVEGCYSQEILNFFTLQSGCTNFGAGYIVNSSRSIEGPYIDLLVNTPISRNDQTWAIGPFNLGVEYKSKDSNGQHKCLKWLDKQPAKSVLFVSFGTTNSMADEQIKELAIGLEKSEQKFLWVLRDADNVDIFEGDDRKGELPEGYEERVKEFGMVVRDWAPQLEILAHPSTGGFMSHCGWNSCLESISMGVPIAAWPMQFDQPKNAFLVTDILKIGLLVNRWTPNQEVVVSSIIVEAIKGLMASEKGKDIKKRAEELGCAARRSVKEGGVSRMKLDSFIAHITSSCAHNRLASVSFG
ncbi:Trans-zeatin O-beta-D-glucosyltransferase [Bertholletia excelsa]